MDINKEKLELVEFVSVSNLQKLVEIEEKYNLDSLLESSSFEMREFIDLDTHDQELLLEIYNGNSYCGLMDIANNEFKFIDDIEECECDDIDDITLYDLMKKEITDDIFEKYNLEQLQKIKQNINEIL